MDYAYADLNDHYDQKDPLRSLGLGVSGRTREYGLVIENHFRLFLGEKMHFMGFWGGKRELSVWMRLGSFF